MNQHLLGKMRQLCVANLGNSRAKAGPMSAASAVGLTCVSRLELNGPTLRHFELQPESLRINQKLPGYRKVGIRAPDLRLLPDRRQRLERSCQYRFRSAEKKLPSFCDRYHSKSRISLFDRVSSPSFEERLRGY